ncbi:DUF3156 family protein [Egicoccus sp. AB-alg6-2]|uniref:DUF3156 family protein n=1 Tax=Egicoccus sp. AB-alg6-2 TaxID=3242692 RepID=UPI00359E6D22
MTRPDLLERVAGDLTGCRLHPVGRERALLETPDGAQCWWRVRDDRRRLLSLQSSRFELDGPSTGAEVRIELRHTGNLRRTGVRGTVKGRDELAGISMRDQLLADGELQAACMALDFTAFTIAPAEGRWRAEIELMGGSHVRTRLPPASNYVRLAEDQVAALLATVAVLHRRLPAATERLVVSTTAAAPTIEGTVDHLPRRNV